jgi:DNA ligase (NAD+)
MPSTHTEALALLKKTGLPVVQSLTVPSAGVLSAVESLNRQRAELPFETDGIVIKVNDLAVRERLGATAHHPRGAMARKYEDTPAQTRLLDVEWSRGATGKLTPVARFEPVEIQGATVQNATLHNLNYIRALDLKIGDWIFVTRSGGTVPEITGICPNRRTGLEISIPDPVH